MRDDFPLGTKELLAKRVGSRCSNPQCRQPTSGPQEDPSKVINIGVACHIKAASPGGPRYDPAQTEEERSSAQNGIWLCQTCAKLVDNDPSRYSCERLQVWRMQAESLAIRDLEKRSHAGETPVFARLERLLPALLAEMRKDLMEHPLRREFVVLQKAGTYWPKGHELAYFYEDHPGLDNMLHILSNHGLIREITYNNTKRYLIEEELAEYLSC